MKAAGTREERLGERARGAAAGGRRGALGRSEREALVGSPDRQKAESFEDMSKLPRDRFSVVQQKYDI